MRIVPIAAAVFALASPAFSVTYNVYEAGTTDLLGNFDSPETGGLLTSAYFALEGGVFTTLAAGNSAPTYDATNNWVRGAGGPFGGVINSIAFNTTEFGSGDPITCDIGKCVFSMTSSSGGGVPPEWYLDYVDSGGGGAAIALGHYEIKIAPIPLPAAGLLLAGGVVALFSLGRRQRAFG